MFNCVGGCEDRSEEIKMFYTEEERERSRLMLLGKRGMKMQMKRH